MRIQIWERGILMNFAHEFKATMNKSREFLAALNSRSISDSAVPGANL